MPDRNSALLSAIARAVAPRKLASIPMDVDLTICRQRRVASAFATSKRVYRALVHRGVICEPQTLGDAIEQVRDMLTEAEELLRRHKADARGDLDPVLSAINALGDNVEDLKIEIACTDCGAYSNDGEGFDGLCGSCADKAESGLANRH